METKHSKQCFSSTEPLGFNNLAKIDTLRQSTYDHRLIRIAASNDNVFAVGSWSPYNAETELLDAESRQWSTAQGRGQNIYDLWFLYC